jgi:hypothetical protein
MMAMKLYIGLYKLLVHTKLDILFSDKTFVKLQYRSLMGKKLNLKTPETFNEKLQWLKLFNREKFYTTLVDKLAVKKYVSQVIGNDIIIPTLFVWDNVDQIKFDILPQQFVLKTTHSGDFLGVVICKDKSSFNFEKAKLQLAKSLKTNYYKSGREWPYKNVQPKIICEKYLEDESGELKDYKFFCFNGEVKAMFVATDRSTGKVKFDYYDPDYNHLDFIQSHPMSDKIIPKPLHFEEMKSIAAKLSQGIPQVRIDLYNVNGNIFFGEMTFFHYGGYVLFHPESWDSKFGEWIKLPNNGRKR